LRANLISTKVSASHRKSNQEHAKPGQTKSQFDTSFLPASTSKVKKTCTSIFLKKLFQASLKELGKKKV